MDISKQSCLGDDEAARHSTSHALDVEAGDTLGSLGTVSFGAALGAINQTSACPNMRPSPRT